jgi:tight adherence protein B
MAATRFQQARNRQKVAGMLHTVDNREVVASSGAILRDAAGDGFAARLLARFDILQKLDRTLRQSGSRMTMRRFFALSGIMAAVGTVLGSFLARAVALPPLPTAAGVALVMGLLPYLRLVRKRKRRLAECEQQLPEALDFLARSMRAGHAFSISLEMLSEETADPLGGEFRSLFNEQNLGASPEAALHNLTGRVPILDLKFFASAIMLQRQTGGNLAEILTRLASVIRERFSLRGQVKAASSHGRLTALILCALPIMTMLGMLAVAPGYLQGMAGDPDGRYLIAFAIGGQLVGNYVIRKIVNIEV